MKRKKIFVSLLASSLIVISLVGCGNSKKNDVSKNDKNIEVSTQNEDSIKSLSGYLGGTYQQLVQKRGEGLDKVLDVEGKKVIDSTKYSIRIFNYDANLIFALDDSKNINSITIHFKGVTPDNLINSVKNELGNPSEVKKNEKTESKDYEWKMDKYQVVLSELGDESIISINKDYI
ncbi:hypothetical protein [Clostridium sp.]|uniref:hypothetical protein n=1 Tax=Clostridium sp. TaxID=1506 RepID=UPI00260F9BCA|nr:hypothetical protein [Clostridium sp.]